MSATHDVLNQVPPLVDYDVFAADRALVEGVAREGAGWATEQLHALGKRAGSKEIIDWGFQANENPPVLKTHDRFGHRIDEVEFHPAWHNLLQFSMEHGAHNLPWREERAGAHVARAAMIILVGQAEAGHGCPISMTYSGVPALQKQPELAAEWVPRILSNTYDSRFIPAAQKRGVLLGMAMTEKQGGSDVRANTTRAVPASRQVGPGKEYLLTGHKWFCSAPMSDAFLVLGQAPGGISCFLLPRWRPDGTRNAFYIQRLKDKLGNRSNASSEIELDSAWAQMVGEEGRGVATIIDMVSHTRLDCALLSTGLMRQAVAQACHHAQHRSAFRRHLVEHGLMRNVLADLCLEQEAATAMVMRLARAYDARDPSHPEALFRRIATAISKYWVCKRAPSHVYEAMECHGGNGYVEESILPRLYREAPLLSIWEGSGNVICLDVLRAMSREPATVEALLAEIQLAKGEPRLDAFVAPLEGELTRLEQIEDRARRIVERLALALQASLLLRSAPSKVAEGFIASRLSGDWGRAFGTLPTSVDAGFIIERATPKLLS